MNWKLTTPARLELVGPSHVGKSELILKLVDDDSVWDQPFKRICYCAPSLTSRDSYVGRLRELCEQGGKLLWLLDHMVI